MLNSPQKKGKRLIGPGHPQMRLPCRGSLASRIYAAIQDNFPSQQLLFTCAQFPAPVLPMLRRIRAGGIKVEQMLDSLTKLRAEAAACAAIRDETTDVGKRELFARLAQHLGVLAAEVERAIERAHGQHD